MNYDIDLQSELIEQLIFHGSATASTLANRFLMSRDEIITCLHALKDEGKVTTGFWQVEGDCFCTHCQNRWPDEEPGAPCPLRHCGGHLRDDCRWRWCGGPVSEALRVAA